MPVFSDPSEIIVDNEDSGLFPANRIQSVLLKSFLGLKTESGKYIYAGKSSGIFLNTGNQLYFPPIMGNIYVHQFIQEEEQEIKLLHGINN